MEAKKYQRYDLKSKTGLFFNIGLTLSLLLVIAAFEWKTIDDNGFVDLSDQVARFDSIIDIPPTTQPPPPIPRISQPVVVSVPDDQEIPEDLLADFDVEILPDAIIEEIVYMPPPVENTDDIIVDFAQQQPEPVGGIAEYYKTIGKSVVYPGAAKRMGITGTVYVQFVIGKDGGISEVEVLKGIGAGCDEEAIRVIREGPKWKPGRQSGRTVKVRMRLPIRFRLSDN